ncbi:hypothetical protein KBD49_15635 [Myxococcota bacterium]|nr:hypothetical protein [Myxococcota bacterium]
MNVGVDSPLDRRASSGTSLCPGNRVRFRDIYVNPGQTSGGWAYLSWCGDGTLFRYCCVWYGQASCH